MDIDNTFLGGIAIPWNLVVKNCPNFYQNFDLIVKQAANATTTGTRIRRINYGAKCALAVLLVAPDCFITLLPEKKNLYKKIRTEKQYELINQRTLIWYRQPARLYNEVLQDLNLKKEVLPVMPLFIESSSHQKIVAFWHITTKTHHYNDIVNDLILMLHSSGLLDQLDSIYYYTVSRRGANLELTDIQKKIKHAFHFGSTVNGDELLTLQKVQEYCRIIRMLRYCTSIIKVIIDRT